MKKLIHLGGLILLLNIPAFATVPLTITVNPHGAGLTDVGTSSITLTAACTYASLPNDNCAAAGTITWTSHDTGAVTVVAGVAIWNGRAVTAGNYPQGLQTAIVAVSATVAGACNGSSTVCTDYMTIQGQHAGDNWQVLTTPSVAQYNDPVTGNPVNLTLAIGAPAAAIGAGYDLNGGGSGNPTYTCNWSSSNSGVVSIDRDGFATAVSPGTATITCNQSGNAVLTGGVLSIPITAITVSAGTTIWYIRPDGDTPWNSVSNTAGHCDGKHDASFASTPGYPTGVNQPCAFGDFEYLYFDQVSRNNVWQPQQNDTVIVRAPGSAVYHTSVINMASYIPINCVPDISDCKLPSPPVGLKIYGENYLSCTGDHGPDPTKTILLSSYGDTGINLALSQDVDIECFEIGPQGAGQTAKVGIQTSALTTGVTIKNVFIHGTRQGTFGSFGVGNTFDHLHIRAGSGFGINTDDAPYTQPSISFVAGLNLQHSWVEFTGCAENYPATGPYPFPLHGCNDTNTDSTAAQDAIGTSNCGGDWVVNDFIASNNFQDGLDLLHCHGHNLIVTNSFFYANDSQQIKLGYFDSKTILNNKVIGNCNRVILPYGGVVIANVGGSPAVNPCRAGGAPFSILFAETQDLVANNTFIAVGNPTILPNCAEGWTGDCLTAAPRIYQNNVTLGYTGASYNSGGTPEAFDPTNAWNTFNYNSYFNVTSIGTTGPNDIFTNPLLAGEVAMPPATPLTNTTEVGFDTYDFNLTSSSPPKWAGATYTGMLATDSNGVAWHVPPSMSADEFSGISTVDTPTFLPVAGTYVGTQSVAISTTTSGASIIYTTNGTTPTVTPLTCTITNGTLYTGPLSVVTSTTINAIGCLTGDNASALATAAYTITAPGSTGIFNIQMNGVIIQ